MEGGGGSSSSGGGSSDGGGGGGKRKRGGGPGGGSKRAKQWTAGQLVEVRGLAKAQYKGSWWQANILEVCSGTVNVEYMALDGEAFEGDENVENVLKGRLRLPVREPPLAFGDLGVNDLVEFNMDGECWWEVQVVAIRSNHVHVLWEKRLQHEIGAADVATKLRRRPA